jgi:uncharacterized protein (TIGR03437 family)
MDRFRIIVYLCCAGLAAAQGSTNLNLTLTGNSSAGWSNSLQVAQTGSVTSLGSAALMMTGSSGNLDDSANYVGPAQIAFELAFNEADTIAIGFTTGDPNFNPMPVILSAGPLTLSGGTITGGTGAYAGASGSLDLTIGPTSNGSGTLTFGGNTMPLVLSNFNGACCGLGLLERDFFTMSANVGGNLGGATARVVGYYYRTPSPQVTGSATIAFNDTDSLILGFSYTPMINTNYNPPKNFNGNIVGGTGKYANASGTISYTSTSNQLTGFTVTGSMTVSPGPVITQVKTIYGLPQIAYNTWLEVHGHNLVPADTSSTGVDWSNAPEFQSGQMPTRLGPVSVTFGGGSPAPGYVYWYCSAQTNPNCADDQINVLAPTVLGLMDPAPMKVNVLRNGVQIASAPSFRVGFSPAFLSFDAKGHIAARHVDASLVGPSALYPGFSTPAKPGETISLYGTGFGPIPDGIVPGSATQSGLLAGRLNCWAAGLTAQAVGALVSPGLYQINLTVPQGVPSGDIPVTCVYAEYPTFPGAIIAVQ